MVYKLVWLLNFEQFLKFVKVKVSSVVPSPFAPSSFTFKTVDLFSLSNTIKSLLLFLEHKFYYIRIIDFYQTQLNAQSIYKVKQKTNSKYLKKGYGMYLDALHKKLKGGDE
ncbi:hypothetical protein BKP57_11980 [Virgibacillus sp. 6R]|nr:hypothetical protein BKP57_11980 [Virgibacillus sp. 6R]